VYVLLFDEANLKVCFLRRWRESAHAHWRRNGRVAQLRLRFLRTKYFVKEIKPENRYPGSTYFSRT
jgi:hypothetical protein